MLSRSMDPRAKGRHGPGKYMRRAMTTRNAKIAPNPSSPARQRRSMEGLEHMDVLQCDEVLIAV